MALSLGKLSILVGAGIVGSVLAKDGGLSNVSDYFSSIFKISLKQFKRDDSTSSSRSPDDTLMSQVDRIRQELQMLASNRSVSVVTVNASGGKGYRVIILIICAGCGYVWWRGWKFPDLMFATKRSLTDACTSFSQHLENVYSSIRTTRKELCSRIDTVDSNLSEVAELTAYTQERVTTLNDDSKRIGHDVRYVRDAVETLELKINRIEGKQDFTNLGVKKLCEHAYNMEINLPRENIQALPMPSISRLTFSSQVASISSTPSQPSSPFSTKRFVERNAMEGPGSAGISSGILTSEGGDKHNSGGSPCIARPKFLQRTCSATNAVIRQMGPK